MSHHLDEYTNQQVQVFLDSIFRQLEEIEIDVSSFQLDHICYRVHSIEDYNRFKELLSRSANLLAESYINSRPISCYKLREAIIYGKRQINVFELPSPKKGSAYLEGYEHVEFVIPYTLQEFLNRYPALNFDQKGMLKDINPDLRLQLGPISVKFHEQSIEEVIEFEKNQ